MLCTVNNTTTTLPPTTTLPAEVALALAFGAVAVGLWRRQMLAAAVAGFVLAVLAAVALVAVDAALATFADQVTTVAREVGVEGKLGGAVNGVFSSWLMFATKSRRTSSSLRISDRKSVV